MPAVAVDGAGDGMDKVSEQNIPGASPSRLSAIRRLPGLAAIGTVLVLGALALIILVAGQSAISQRRATARIEQQAGLAQDLATALVTAENGARGFVLTGDPDALEPYYRGREQAQVALARAAGYLDEWQRRGEVEQPLADMANRRLAALGQMVELAYRELADPAYRPRRPAAMPGTGDELRRGLDRAVAAMRAETAANLEQLNHRTNILLPAMTAVLVLGLGLSVLGFVAIRRENRDRHLSDMRLAQHVREVALLRGLTQGMQTVRDRAGGHRVIAEQLADVFADCSGLLFLYDPQRDRFVPVADWGPLIVAADRTEMLPADCLAARRAQAVTGRRDLVHAACDHVEDEAYCYRCLPILIDGQITAILHLRLAGTAEPEAAFAALGSLPESAARLLGLALSTLDLRERLDTQALHDPLTGLCNRGFLDEVLRRELDRAAAGGRPLALVVAGIDNFQALGERHGVRAGDEILKTVAGFLRSQLRDADLLCRFGGDRMALLLPDTDIDEACRIADQLRRGVARLHPAIGREIVEDLSLSVGVAGAGRDGRTAEALAAAAERAVSRAKLAGRDRVSRADEVVGAA
ncbi:MAG: diguanylate cyclase [Alphaproteobacteria bacterium]|nr:diguanylate cyclase [Alphaproteobacteria bacterium]